MSTVYTQTGAEPRAVDVNWLSRRARILVGHVMRHMQMDSSERSIFREDMMQEGSAQLAVPSCLCGWL
jgi:hypothetical protein